MSDSPINNIELDVDNYTPKFDDLDVWEPISYDLGLFIAENGKYYNPAWKRYANATCNISDDKYVDAINNILKKTADNPVNSDNADNPENNENVDNLDNTENPENVKFSKEEILNNYEIISHIRCDFCGRGNLTECYGYLDNDICIICQKIFIIFKEEVERKRELLKM